MHILSVVLLGVVMLNVIFAARHYAECCYVVSFMLCVVILTVVMLSDAIPTVVMLSVVILTVVMLSVVVSFFCEFFFLISNHLSTLKTH